MLRRRSINALKRRFKPRKARRKNEKITMRKEEIENIETEYERTKREILGELKAETVDCKHWLEAAISEAEATDEKEAWFWYTHALEAAERVVLARNKFLKVSGGEITNIDSLSLAYAETLSEDFRKADRAILSALAPKRAQLEWILQKAQSAKNDKELFDLIKSIDPYLYSYTYKRETYILQMPYLDCDIPLSNSDVEEALRFLDAAPDKTKFFDYIDELYFAYLWHADKVIAICMYMHKDLIINAIKEKLKGFKWAVDDMEYKLEYMLTKTSSLADVLSAKARKQEPLNPQGTLKHTQKH